MQSDEESQSSTMSMSSFDTSLVKLIQIEAEIYRTETRLIQLRRMKRNIDAELTKTIVVDCMADDIGLGTLEPD